MIWIWLIAVLVMIALFFYAIWRVVKIRQNAQTTEYDIACAGNFEPGTPETKRFISESLTFLDKNGKVLDVAQFERYIVSGESMRLCGIHNNDLLLAEKYLSNSSIAPLEPAILIILRTNAKQGEAKYKVRRSWNFCAVDVNDWWTQSLQEIVQSPAFQKLRMQKIYVGDDELIRDFEKERLPRFREQYPNAEKEKASVIISTTLDTKSNKIHFSIHPVSEIVGIVKYAYTVQKGS
ncbi:MAG: hypothetical protein J1E79_01810 [Rikenella sp.]|nr:hypothetical protein [Rikenella sp.]